MPVQMTEPMVSVMASCCCSGRYIMYSKTKYRSVVTQWLTLATGNGSLCISGIGLANSPVNMTLITDSAVPVQRASIVPLYIHFGERVFHTVTSVGCDLWYRSTLVRLIVKRLAKAI